MSRIALRPAASGPDLFVRTADGSWNPAYSVASSLVEGVQRTMFFVQHADGVEAVTPERLNDLSEQGRVVAVTPLLAVVNDDPPAHAPDRAPAPSARLKSARGVFNSHDKISRWEAFRRLLNARCSQLEETTGEDHDDIRHRAASVASNGRTESSMDLTESEMEDAVTAVEHELWEAGFDIEKADAEYAERRARKLAA